MTFNIQTVTAKNFLSIGNQTQAVNFTENHLTLVIGSNLDLGGDDSGSRNGVGKTAILNALSYALYGNALTKIKKENLINKINGKHMLVTVEFEKNNVKYKIERGRKPNILKFFINNTEIKASDENESQGDSRETQKSIEQVLEMSHTMFKHLLALNTYTEPFLSMGASDQREVIEQLLGITILSEKAENLKENHLKETKELIQKETFRLEGIKTANLNVQRSIDSLKLKSKAWETKKEEEIEALGKAIFHLENVDIEKELLAHAKIKLWEENDTLLRNLNKQKAMLEASLSQATKTKDRYTKEIETLKTKICPACDQQLQDHKHQEMSDSALLSLLDSQKYVDKLASDINKIKDEINVIEIVQKPNTFYDTEVEALGHKNNLDSLEKRLTEKLQEKDPYKEQIEELKNTAIQEVDWSIINNLTKLKDHQEFLLKLLTNKDSFIRKKIIDQNLAYLNKRLGYYIDRLGLPHRVIFKNDLTVEITQLGQDLDFDNLSRGERNRLILSMSFAFRDVWEGLYHNTNLLFIDELVDSGMDSAGVECALSVLKKMARDRSKNIYLISHKDELVGRVNSVLRVVKEGGFTTYSTDIDYVN